MQYRLRGIDGHFSQVLLQYARPIDIRLQNATQWLKGELDVEDDEAGIVVITNFDRRAIF